MSKSTYPKKLVIDRKKWNGNPKFMSESIGLSEKGKRCCLGHWAKACGVSDRKMEHCGMPDEIPMDMEVPLCISPYKDTNSAFARRMQKVNDSMRLSMEEKESKIKIGFAKHGVKVTFVN